MLGAFDLDRVLGTLLAAADRADPDSLARLAVWCLDSDIDLLRLAQAAKLAGRSDYRQCAEPGCIAPAMARKGNRGPVPRRCEEHAKARKREQDTEGQRSRRAGKQRDYPECCQTWQASGRSGACDQHEQHRKVSRAMAGRRHEQLDFLLDVFGPGSDRQHARGWHYTSLDAPLKPDRGNPDRGPDEGRTRFSKGDPAAEILGPDPFADPAGKDWFAVNRGWLRDERKVPELSREVNSHG